MKVNSLDHLAAYKIPGKQTGIEIRKTICAICEGSSNSCGVNAYVQDGRVVKVEGLPEFPQNRGSLCAKGCAARQYIYNADRIQSPMRRRGADFEPLSWEAALDLIAEKLLKIKQISGPQAVVFGVGYTKWLRPFLQRLAVGFGSPNLITESSTCFYATQIAAQLTYGAWGGPDLARTQCLLVWSRNLFHTATPLARRLLERCREGLKIIEVNPVVTPLTRHAHLHLGLQPGTDGALALGLAQVIIAEDLYDHAFVRDWTEGFEAFREYVRRFTPEETTRITGVPPEAIVTAARCFAGAASAAIMTSASPTVHHTNGVQNHRAIIALSGLTGNFDTPGGNIVVPESWLHVGSSVPTRQHAFMLPRPLEELAARVGSERFPLFTEFVPEAQGMALPWQILSGRPYPIRAVLAFGWNQRMWPGNDLLLKALAKLDLFVNMDLFWTDTARRADIVLPACSSFERSELRIYPGNHVIYTQPAIAPLGQARSDSEVIFELARRIAPEDTLMARGYEACLNWILAPSGLTIDQLKQLPAGLTLRDLPPPAVRKYEQGGFATPSGKMEFVSRRLAALEIPGLPVYQEPLMSLTATPELACAYPLVLTTGGRLPMYMHSRTFRVPWNRRLDPQPTVQLNPGDAAARRIVNHDAVNLATPRGSVTVKARLSDCLPPGVATIYHGWPEVEVNQLIDPDYLDPLSGFPGFKSLLCEVQKAV